MTDEQVAAAAAAAAIGSFVPRLRSFNRISLQMRHLLIHDTILISSAERWLQGI